MIRGFKRQQLKKGEYDLTGEKVGERGGVKWKRAEKMEGGVFNERYSPVLPWRFHTQ